MAEDAAAVAAGSGPVAVAVPAPVEKPKESRKKNKDKYTSTKQAMHEAAATLNYARCTKQAATDNMNEATKYLKGTKKSIQIAFFQEVQEVEERLRREGKIISTETFDKANEIHRLQILKERIDSGGDGSLPVG